MPEHTVTSEIYTEYDYSTAIKPHLDGNLVSEFPFVLPPSPAALRYDEDNDLDVERPKKEVIRIEHSPRTELRLVGLQVWRGAFLLGDLLISLGVRGDLQGSVVLELGAGTGISGIVAAMYARRVVCTDLDVGGILPLIELNAKNNANLVQADFSVLALDFTKPWSQAVQEAVDAADVILAADVVYDDDITAAFVATVQRVLNAAPPKTLYVALEKRYVFTIENLDSVAPCYETFLSLIDKVKTSNQSCEWEVREMALDFPKYFHYDRVKELVLWRISSHR